ncbi:MAG: lysophospholipid acyltransferase family protein [Gammaproteobacteria bacterium]
MISLVLRSAVFTGFMILSVVVVGWAVILGVVLPFPVRYRVAPWWARMNLALLRRLCGLDYRVEGAEHIGEYNGIAMWKHQSAWETIAQIAIFPIQAWVFKRELMWVPILGWALACMRPIAINRKGGRAAVQQVLRQGRERLEAGEWVMIFPEGTRMPPGTTRRYGVSGALLSTQTGYPIVPVAHNAGDFWPRRGLRKRPGTVIVRIGPPIEPRGRRPDEINREVQEWIEAQMREISSNYQEASAQQE